VGVLAAGLLRGVLLGVIITVLMLLRRASKPHITELGRVPGTAVFADLRRHKENALYKNEKNYQVRFAFVGFVQHWKNSGTGQMGFAALRGLRDEK